MSSQDHNDKTPPHAPAPARSFVRRFHSPAGMLILVLLLLIFLAFYLSTSFGIEGEGGWLNEVFGAVLAIGAIIVISVCAAGLIFWLKSRLRQNADAPWIETLEEDVGRDEPGQEPDGRHPE